MQPHSKTKLAILISACLLTNYSIAQDVIETEPVDADRGNLQEQTIEVINVTGTGRSASAAEIPMNITAIGAAELRRKNITDVKRLIEDSVEISAPGNSNRVAESVTIRGLNVAPVNANNLEQFVRTTIAYYLDDTPLPNIGYRIKDVERVEILMGPQGTLYGGGSLGGTIRYITNQPQLDDFSFDTNLSVYQPKNGGLSHDTDVVINVPLSDTFAFRGSFANLDDAGFTDRASNHVIFTDEQKRISQPNPNQDIYEDDDWEETKSGKLALLWKPTDEFDVTLSYIRQDQLAHGTRGASRFTIESACERESLVGDACTDRYTRFTTPFQYNDHTVVSTYDEFSDRDFEMTSIRFDWDLGFADLTSSTSDFEDSRVGQADYFGFGLAYYGFIPGLGFDQTNESAYLTYDNTYTGINHETRLTSKIDGPTSWIVGFYYSDTEQDNAFSEVYPGFDAAAGSSFLGFDRVAQYSDTRLGTQDEGYFDSLFNDYKETALFGELTYAVNDKLDVTAGIRYFRYEDNVRKTIVDYTGLTNSDSSSQVKDNEAFYKLNVAYDLTDNLLTYATFSQGFRRGGANAFKNGQTTDEDGETVALIVSPDAQNFQPDSTDNYELGIKGFLLDRSLFMQANVYRIEWNNVQTYFSQLIDGVFPLNGTANGPSAVSTGFEFNARYKINDEWSVRLSSATVDAEWDETIEKCLFTAVLNAPDADLECRTWNEGGKLGGAPEWRHNYGISYQTDLYGGYFSFNLDGRFTGKTQSDRQDFVDEDVYTRDSYTLFNTSVGYGREDWTVTVWVDNLTDEDAETSAQFDIGQGIRTIFVRPRTIGMNLSYRY